MKKLHIGCGGVYLTDGWINVDIPDPGVFLAKDRPDLVKKNSTIFNNYYKDPYYNNYYSRFMGRLENRKMPPSQGQSAKVKDRRFVVADILAWADKLPFKPKTIDTILSVQMIEHLTLSEVLKTLKHWHLLLKEEGKVWIDLPDIIETAHLLFRANRQSEREWAEKLIYGNRDNEFAYHKVGYWPEKLRDILWENGFTTIRRVHIIKHDYPAFTMEAIKNG